MNADLPSRAETDEHRRLRDSVWNALPSWRRYVIAVDGRDGAGKSPIARYLAWQIAMPVIELDQFRDLRRTPFDFRIDDLRRNLQARLERDRPVIIEGVTVLRALEEAGFSQDFLVFLPNEDPSLPEVAPQLREYFRHYKPNERADFHFRWP